MAATSDGPIELRVGQDVWPAIKEVGAKRQRRPAALAVAYFTHDPIGLRKGDMLVVNLENVVCAAGQTNPFELRKLQTAGVRIYRSAGLHAKIMVFGDTVVIGSTNFSKSSVVDLREAVALVRSIAVAAEARKLIEGLADAEVDAEQLRAAEAVYQPPKGVGPGTGGQPGRFEPVRATDRLWLIGTEARDAPATVLQAAGRRRPRRGPGHFVYWVWQTGALAEGLSPGDVVIFSEEDEDGVEWVYPPGRVVDIVDVPAKGRGGPWTITYVRQRSDLSELESAGVRQAMKPYRLRWPPSARLITDETAKGTLLALWTGPTADA